MELINITHDKKEHNIYKKIIDYLSHTDINQLTTGCTYIEEDQFFVNILIYQTNTSDQRIWEAHHDYLDVHLMLAGEEYIDHNFIEKMTLGAYHLEEDNQEVFGVPANRIHLLPQQLLILYPGDAHKTGICVDRPISVKKAVFKLKL